jgi:hypothetical protein
LEVLLRWTVDWGIRESVGPAIFPEESDYGVPVVVSDFNVVDIYFSFLPWSERHEPRRTLGGDPREVIRQAASARDHPEIAARYYEFAYAVDRLALLVDTAEQEDRWIEVFPPPLSVRSIDK